MHLREFHNWIKRKINIRYAFFILLVSSIFLSKFLLPNNSNLYFLYIILSVFLGIGFYKKPYWFLIFFTVILVVSRFLLIQDQILNLENFLTHLTTYLIIVFISAGLKKNVQKVKEDQIDLIKALANALDLRDTYTLNHSDSVAKNSYSIARKLGLSNSLCNIVEIGGLLHDIGKIGIPESILNKSSKLTELE